MTTTSAQLQPPNHSHTYQHIQGTMLLNLNKLSSTLNLSHTEYRLMGTLIGLYNKLENKAFPTIEYLASCCCMGKQTILKSLSHLVELNLLVVVKTPGKRNNYYFSSQILNTSCGIHVKPPLSIACNTVHDTTNRIRTNRKQTLHQTKHDLNINKANINDDVSLNNPDNSEYKQTIDQLNKWSYTGAQFAIKRHGIEKIKSLIDQTKQNNPSSPGAYLRTLLNLPGHNIPDQKINPLKSPLNNGLISTKQILNINEPRLSKKEIIQQLIQEGKTEESQILCRIWKLII